MCLQGGIPVLSTTDEWRSLFAGRCGKCQPIQATWDMCGQLSWRHARQG